MHFASRFSNYFPKPFSTSVPPNATAIRIMYPQSNILRHSVTVDKKSWDVEFNEYDPPTHTAKPVLNAPVWADPTLEKMENFAPKFNDMDGKINRKSHQGNYKVLNGRIPLNPHGRTGLKGQGLLGRWGPNHAADPIVTRWKRDEQNMKVVHPRSNLPILQFVAIERKDSKEWAIPGGMVDAGENVSVTLKREFGEEALNSLEIKEQEKEDLQKLINQVFNNGVLIYKGVVEDPRNTDNSWMETCAYNFHDNSGDSVGKLSLTSGDDASNVRWMDIDKYLQLYANHEDMIKRVASLHQAHW